MKLWDVTMEIGPGMPVWKGRESKKPIATITRDFANGDSARETQLTIDMHTGTHIDAPLHFIRDGQTIDEISLDRLVRPAKVIDLTSVASVIERSDLIKHPIEPEDFILLKTRNSYEDILQTDFVYIGEEAARYLAEEAKVAGVGIDGLGVERDQPEHGTHHALLGAGIIIIEGLRLKAVEQGDYLMIAAPLKVKGLEAAPARVLLTELK